MKTYARNVLGILMICGLIFLLLSCGKRSAGGADLEKVYQDYHQAIQEEDIDALKDLVAEEKQQELLGEGAEMKIGMIKGLLPTDLPTDIEVIKAEVSGSEGVLHVKGRMQEQQMSGEVKFVREGGKWKIAKEHWTMSLGADEQPAVPDFAGQVQPFMKDPDQPPRPHLLLDGHQGEVTELLFGPYGQYLISVSYGDYSLRVWDVASGEQLSSARTPNRVRSMALSADGVSILTADAYNNVLSWPLDDGMIGEPRTLVKDAGDQLAVSPDRKYIATTAFKKTLRLWNFEDGSLVKELSGDVNLRSLAFSPSGKYLANGSHGNTFTLWDTKKWKKKKYTVAKVSQTSDVSTIDISRDGKYLATGHMDSSIVIFDLEEREELHNFYVPQASTWDVRFAPDGKLLATAQQNKTIYLWETATAKQAAKLKEHSEAVRCLAFSPDGVTLASGGEDRKIILWRSGAVEPVQFAQTPTAAKPGTKGKVKPEMMELAGQKNLVKNPFANQDFQFWQTKGDVSVWEDDEANPYFAIRYSGMIWQDVKLPPNSAGRWLLLISWSMSERINEDGDQTGLPYLYGYMINAKDPNRIDAYLSGQKLKHELQEANAWDLIWGVFQVPAGSAAVRLFLQQADGRYPQDGSAACFDEPGIFLFNSRQEAEDFVKAYE